MVKLDLLLLTDEQGVELGLGRVSEVRVTVLPVEVLVKT